MEENIEKIKNGQFYTIRNPFNHPLVKEWFQYISSPENKSFIEPFAGANHIPKQFIEVFPEVKDNQWLCYDLEPEKIVNNQLPHVSILENDSLKNPPHGDVAITNPPYLAKNSATRKKMTDIDFKNFNDLYEVSLDTMLQNNDYVAAIIPESFITKNIFKERLFGVISITHNLFDDTDFPVCLALWLPSIQQDYKIYSGEKYIGYAQQIFNNTKLFQTHIDKNVKIIFNDPYGVLGLTAIDNNNGNSISFKRGSVFSSNLIKNTSRSFTRITVKNVSGENIFCEDNIDEAIVGLNKILSEFRKNTADIFLTSFKNIRKDGHYRRRLDWRTATLIINYYLSNYSSSLDNSFNLFNMDL